LYLVDRVDLARDVLAPQKPCGRTSMGREVGTRVPQPKQGDRVELLKRGSTGAGCVTVTRLCWNSGSSRSLIGCTSVMTGKKLTSRRSAAVELPVEKRQPLKLLTFPSFRISIFQGIPISDSPSAIYSSFI
jgi:hypothetical protein